MARAQVQSLVGELRFLKLCSVAKKSPVWLGKARPDGSPLHSLYLRKKLLMPFLLVI